MQSTNRPKSRPALSTKDLVVRIFSKWVDYVRTLCDWRIRFRSAWPSIEQMGFDERFRRLWEYYLAYSETGFRSGIIDVRQIVFVRQS